MTQAEGVIMVPHLWKTGLSIAAAVHLAAATRNCPYIEYLPPELSESSLRRELLTREPVMAAGQVTLPDSPGLGIELNRDAMHRFAEAARRVRP
jgi:L-alanine-DL-glutamate epimerase-like enolase superfamily enzyme